MLSTSYMTRKEELLYINMWIKENKLPNKQLIIYLKFLPPHHWFLVQRVRFRGGIFVLFPYFYCLEEDFFVLSALARKLIAEAWVVFF